ncbi:Cysteine-rich secretory protein family protein [Lutibacter agarilyticus]|uniref:Cysteine-rich secretory protein family protein n=1 Tax=Lutibacter agarilyticus TaxID=1109740 RepID=A0A238XS16_9FLAO|nr:CAP domain-containing protein [Lutibacter agarilyticus]SNR61785.1 Cysteine-rich secretory protein family protein [Lutibacter agarilyticus]
MKSLTPKLIAVLILSIALFSCSNDEDGIYFDETSEITIVEKIQYSTIELEILDLVNAHRQSIDLQTLKTLDIVSGVAEGHTNYMIETGQISHDNFPKRSEVLIKNAKAKAVGENVAYGYGSAEAVVNGWLNSEGHREVIESTKYTHFGISTECNSEGRNYFTHMFINK